MMDGVLPLPDVMPFGWRVERIVLTFTLSSLCATRIAADYSDGLQSVLLFLQLGVFGLLTLIVGLRYVAMCGLFFFFFFFFFFSLKCIPWFLLFGRHLCRACHVTALANLHFHR